MRLTIPYTDEDELEEVRKVLASGYLTQGPKVTEFEKTVAECVGTKHALAVSSATTALHLSLVVLGISPGDEVLVPDFTFPATANVVIQQGAIPVLTDINIATFSIDVDDMLVKMTPKTKAVIPVHLFGLAADMDPILRVAQERRVAVVEDAACAMGATYKGRPCGSMGDLGCFSFHPRKIVTTGEGGMITTDRDDLANKIRMLRMHGGIRRGGRYRFEAPGYNYRLSDIQAAVGVAQMRKLEYVIKRRRELAWELAERLRQVKAISIPGEPAWAGHIYQSFVILLDEEIDRDKVIVELRDEGIEATLGTYALHVQPYYRDTYGYEEKDFPQSLEAFRRSLALPLHPGMDEDDVISVAVGLEKALREVG